MKRIIFAVLTALAVICLLSSATRAETLATCLANITIEDAQKTVARCLETATDVTVEESIDFSSAELLSLSGRTAGSLPALPSTIPANNLPAPATAKTATKSQPSTGFVQIGGDDVLCDQILEQGSEAWQSQCGEDWVLDITYFGDGRYGAEDQAAIKAFLAEAGMAAVVTDLSSGTRVAVSPSGSTEWGSSPNRIAMGQPLPRRNGQRNQELIEDHSLPSLGRGLEFRPVPKKDFGG